MKRILGLALYVLFAIVALAFTVSNFVPPAEAWVIYGTVTEVPGGLPPGNEWLHLYGDFYCIGMRSNCCVIFEV